MASLAKVRASRYMSLRCSRSSLPKFRLYFPAIRLNSLALFLRSFSALFSGCSASFPSTVLANRASFTRARFPMRITFKLAAKAFSVNKSAAALLGAVTKTCFSFLTSCRITSTKVVVFPVPGGPWIMDTSFAAKTWFKASFCEAFRWGIWIGCVRLANSGFLLPQHNFSQFGNSVALGI